MSGLRIVDAHHHLWSLENHYPWLEADPMFETFIGDYSPLCRNYEIGDFLADAANQRLTLSVHIQCEFDPSNPVGETAWLQGLADEHGFPHGIVAWADLADPGGVAAAVTEPISTPASSTATTVWFRLCASVPSTTMTLIPPC